MIDIRRHPSAFGANVIVSGEDDFPQLLPSCSITALRRRSPLMFVALRFVLFASSADNEFCTASLRAWPLRCIGHQRIRRFLSNKWSFAQLDGGSSVFNHVSRAPTFLSINGSPVVITQIYETCLFAFTVFNRPSILARRYSSDSRE
jgi:hypothetical protein